MDYRDNNQFQGVLLVDKPADENSFASIAKLRRLLGIKRIGHCGTLDPFATGLLPVCIGRATSAVNYMQDFDKEYEVEISFGARTNTQDCEGTITEKVDLLAAGWDLFTLSEQVRYRGAQLVGELEQEPPMFSAIKVAGKPLHYYARKGQEIERKKRKVHIYNVKPLNYDRWRIHCSKGTYIRSWVDYLGTEVGCLAHARKLRRLKCGPLRVDDERCVDLEELFLIFNSFGRDPLKMRTYLCESGLLISPVEIFKEWQCYDLDNSQARRIVHGQAITVQTDALPTDIILLYQGQLLAFAKANFISDRECEIKAGRVLLSADEVKLA